MTLISYNHVVASLTNVEHSFSKGGQTVPWFCHSLSDETTCASTVMGSWATLNGAIDRTEIIALFKNKKSRQGAAKRQKPNPDDVIDIDND